MEASRQTWLCHCSYQCVFVEKFIQARFEVSIVDYALDQEAHRIPFNVYLRDAPPNEHINSADVYALQSRHFLLFDVEVHSEVILIDDILHRGVKSVAHICWCTICCVWKFNGKPIFSSRTLEACSFRPLQSFVTISSTKTGFVRVINLFGCGFLKNCTSSKRNHT